MKGRIKTKSFNLVAAGFFCARSASAKTPAGRFLLYQGAHIGPLSDGRMGASRERAERIRVAMSYQGEK